ncbi:mannose-1-phosphate guanylyltransferase [Brachybacterium sp. FME24]|uniref:mannose-1-phosphate guanylyltransferase n=1 Tax=Brachybacterium sp. FME24 TaxID=2742605 RepID=UPI0018666A20|nr:mannose-1-phosphate guanylyltransferase [Brachybacterium sp. FME24]
MPQAPFVPVIPAGGAGTRLWPLSRRSRPKFLLDLTGSGASLLQQTVDRLAPFADRPPIVVTGVDHAVAVRDQMRTLPAVTALSALSGPSAQPGAPSEPVRILAEPTPRNSMPAIALAAALVERDDPDAVIGSFAADHLIGDHAAFAATVTAARRAAELGYLVTLGIEPTYPATGFGYIQEGGGVDVDPRALAALRATGARPVSRFVEKPDRERAEQFLAQGSFFWNAGMFVVRAQVLLDELAAQIPALAAGAREIAAAHGTADYDRVLAATWPRLTSIAIDHALAEPLAADGKVAVVPASFDWDDVGDFEALARQLRDGGPGSSAPAAPGGSEGSDPSDVRVLGSSAVDAIGSTATVYGSTDRHIALVGLRGISIVDTEDVLLVLADEQAQALTGLVARLDEQGRGRLL